jgi:potassium-transporting ATPase potassium-binding subunit
MARVYQGEHSFLDRPFQPVERFFYRVSDVKPDEDLNWKTSAIALMLFNAPGFLIAYGLRRKIPWQP